MAAVSQTQFGSGLRRLQPRRLDRQRHFARTCARLHDRLRQTIEHLNGRRVGRAIPGKPLPTPRMIAGPFNTKVTCTAAAMTAESQSARARRS